MKYKDLELVNGSMPKKGDFLTVNYLYNLTIAGKKENVQKRLFYEYRAVQDQVMKGWEMAVMDAGPMPPMTVGSKRKVLIPRKFAYGEDFNGGFCEKENPLPFAKDVCSIPNLDVVPFYVRLVCIG